MFWRIKIKFEEYLRHYREISHHPIHCLLFRQRWWLTIYLIFQNKGKVHVGLVYQQLFKTITGRFAVSQARWHPLLWFFFYSSGPNLWFGEIFCFNLWSRLSWGQPMSNVWVFFEVGGHTFSWFVCMNFKSMWIYKANLTSSFEWQIYNCLERHIVMQ